MQNFDSNIVLVESNNYYKLSYDLIFYEEGYNVISLKSYKDAYSLLSKKGQSSIRMILSDINLTDTKNYEKEYFLKIKKEYSNVPFCFITSNRISDVRNTVDNFYYNSTFNQIFERPRNPLELKEIIEKIQ